MQKNQLIPLIPSWGTANFRVLNPGWSHLFFTIITFLVTLFFNQLDLYHMMCINTKNSNYFIILFCKCTWFKNPAIWLARSILDHTPRTRFFIETFPNFCRNIENNINFHYRPTPGKAFHPFSRFLGQKNCFKKNLILSSTTSYGFSTLCQNLEKTNAMIHFPIKRLDTRKDGRRDRPNFIGHFWLPRGREGVKVG